ncbi:MAG: DinB family protein [Fimbriimonadales bacterium]
MDIRDALKGQYHASLRMLRECVEVCPENVWTAGEFPREFWKIAYHGVFYAHLYLGQNEAAFRPWSKHRQGAQELWKEDAVQLEPNSRAEVMEYLDEVRGMINETIDALDIDTQDSGFHWYPNFPKLEHLVLSIRHIQGHVGQLSELLFAQGIETSWFSRRA